MFFNTRKKKARETAIALENGFRAHFGLTEHITRDGSFVPPPRFYFDNYILGFSTTFINLSMAHLLNMKNDPPEKKGEFILDVLSNMSMSAYEYNELKLYLLRNLAELQREYEFESGADHAILMFGLTFGMINPTKEHPLVQQSYDMAREYLRMGIASDHKSAQVASLSQLTLGIHIKTRFLGSNN